ncbi:hypothetical protein D3C72_1823740 [compost metagenome]
MILLQRLADKAAGIDHGNESAVRQVIRRDPGIGIKEQRAGGKPQRPCPAQPTLADIGTEQQRQHQQHENAGKQQQRRVQANSLKTLEVIGIVADQVENEQQFLEITAHDSLAKIPFDPSGLLPR